MNNVQVIAKAAKLFKVPTVITTVAADSFSGPFMRLRATFAQRGSRSDIPTKNGAD